jgi:DNA-binding GntR family transcriptional regulator
MRTAIFQGAMQPGEHLCQHALALSYATSRAPVREALVQLQAEGLLQHDPNRGYFVRKFAWSDVSQLYKMRRWLEGQLLGSVLWPEAASVDKIVSLEAGRGRARARNAVDGLNLSVRLRGLLFGLSTEKVLLREAGRLWARLDRLNTYFPTEGVYAFSTALRERDHALLLDCHARERDEAERVLDEAQSAFPGIWSRAA